MENKELITQLQKLKTDMKRKQKNFNPSDIQVLDNDLEREAVKLGYKLAVIDVMEIIEDAIAQNKTFY